MSEVELRLLDQTIIYDDLNEFEKNKIPLKIVVDNEGKVMGEDVFKICRRGQRLEHIHRFC